LTLDGIDNNDQRQGYAFTGVLAPHSIPCRSTGWSPPTPTPRTGRSSWAQVVLLTKSGTNQFHGSLYEYNRNAGAVANDFFNKTAELQAGLPNKPGALIRNTFGDSVGGPIKRDKLFFFLKMKVSERLKTGKSFKLCPRSRFVMAS
jgi:hypothetical protein